MTLNEGGKRGNISYLGQCRVCELCLADGWLDPQEALHPELLRGQVQGPLVQDALLRTGPLQGWDLWIQGF